MAGLQTILNYSNGLQIDRRNVVGIQYTRNEVARTSLTPTFNPWRFRLDMPSRYRYSEARALMESLDTLDRYTPELVTFSNISQLSWIFAYQGQMTNSEINAITVSSFSGNQLVLTNLPAVGASTILFKPNDLIQIGTGTNNPFPFTSTTEVLRGGGSTVTVTTHRPNIISTSVAGSSIKVGNSCYFYMFCPNMPVYKLIPGGHLISGSNTVNNALIEFSDSFMLYEWVATA